MTIPPLLFILIVLAVALAFEGVRSLVGSKAERRAARASKRLRTLRSPVATEDQETLLRREEEQTTLARLLSSLPLHDHLELQLYRAGSTLEPSRFLAVSLAIAAAGAVAALAFLPAPGSWMLGAVAGVGPYVNLRRIARKRLRAFEQQFPDALDLLIRALRAGHSFSVGLQMVGEELPDPIGREFALVAYEIQLGLDIRRALANLVHRVSSSDLPFFVVAVGLQQETGSNLAEVLGNLADVIRERFKLYGKVNALTSMGRASANLLVVWPAVMLSALYAVNPDYVRPLWETDAGHSMIIAAVIMVAVGYVVCRRMATIEV